MLLWTVAVLLALAAIPGCGTGGSSSSLSGQSGPASVSDKPDLTSLTDSMLLVQAEFPSLDSGQYDLQPVGTVGRDGNDDYCLNMARTGDQKGQAAFNGEAAAFTDVLELRRSKVDMQAWATKCFPRQNGGFDFALLQLANLPAGVIGFQMSSAGKVVAFAASGYIRGVMVGASVDFDSASHPESPKKAQDDLVAIFNRQVTKLNSF